MDTFSKTVYASEIAKQCRFAINVIQTESTLIEQPKGAELEYRVIAINKSGDCSESNTVMVVL